MAEPGKARAARQPTRRRILVVDDHPVVRDGLAAEVATEPDLVVSSATGDPAEALTLIASQQPDLAVVDISLAKRSGLDLIRQIRAQGHTVKILVWSMHPESLYAERALRAGAQGYIEKSCGPEEVLGAIRSVLAGKVYASSAITERVLKRLGSGPRRDERSGVETLSDRELHAFELMGAGLSTVEIARRMCLSVKTVETYRARIKGKLGLATFPEVIQHATAWLLEQR
ncbi:MAG: response regulator transcription factor [bacterium]